MSIERAPQPLQRSPERERIPPSKTAGQVEEGILALLRAIQFGSVEITIHDSRVVQVERREKLRFDGSARAK